MTGRDSTIETARVVNRSSIEIDAAILAKLLGIKRTAASVRLCRAFKEGLINKVSTGKYVKKQ